MRCSSFFIHAYLLLILFSRFAYSDVSYDYIKDKDGNNLDLIYKTGESEISGELAIERLSNKLLFISCELSSILDNEYHMRRDSRNCSKDFTVWPELLLTHVSASIGKAVTLGGVPSTCGVCTDIPYADFELPDSAKIEQGIHIIPIVISPEMRKSLNKTIITPNLNNDEVIENNFNKPTNTGKSDLDSSINSSGGLDSGRGSSSGGGYNSGPGGGFGY